MSSDTLENENEMNKMEDKIMSKAEVKTGLQEQLEKVRQKLLLLDEIEAKLLQMKSLAQRILDEALTENEIGQINRNVNELEVQVRLLNKHYDEICLEKNSEVM